MNLAKLKHIANESTPGPWKVGNHPSKVVAPCPCCGDIAVCAQYGPGEETENYNSKYIAAFNPQVALELIVEIERLRSELAAAQRRFEMSSTTSTDRGVILDTISDLIDEWKAAEAGGK